MDSVDSYHNTRNLRILILMKKMDKEKMIHLSISALLLIVCMILVIGHIRGGGDAESIKNTQTVKDTGKKLFDVETVAKETVTVNTDIIEDGLREMGTLITQEYYFTQVEEYTSTKKWAVFESEASFTYSYDGVVSAGIDCDNVTVEKYDEAKKITITIPKAEIKNIVIDHDSFKIYEEKNGLWNKIDMSNYNDSIIEFEDSAREKAMEKGILDKADESAEKMIGSFAKSLVDTDEYTIECNIR